MKYAIICYMVYYYIFCGRLYLVEKYYLLEYEDYQCEWIWGLEQKEE